MRGTIKCESGFNPKAHNKSDPYGGAKGVGQFLQGTFNRYSVLAGIEDGDVWRADDSIHTMAYMFQTGNQHQWTCWRNLYGKI